MRNGFENEILGLRRLREFLETAPKQFRSGESIRKHELPNMEQVSCILWDHQFYISGMDILRCIIYRFQAFGRRISNRTKFEELAVGDLRNLKINMGARLEEGKSEMLEFLHKNGCIRTKKKQRVFYWDAVPHDKLFLESLERELRRAVIGNNNLDSQCITMAIRDPALSISYSPMHKLISQMNQILLDTPSDQQEVMYAIFGAYTEPHIWGTIKERERTKREQVNDIATEQTTNFTYPIPSTANVLHNSPTGFWDHVHLPQINHATKPFKDVHFPRIHDALPAHVHVEHPPEVTSASKIRKLSDDIDLQETKSSSPD